MLRPQRQIAIAQSFSSIASSESCERVLTNQNAFLLFSDRKIKVRKTKSSTIFIFFFFLSLATSVAYSLHTIRQLCELQKKNKITFFRVFLRTFLFSSLFFILEKRGKKRREIVKTLCKLCESQKSINWH